MGWTLAVCMAAATLVAQDNSSTAQQAQPSASAASSAQQDANSDTSQKSKKDKNKNKKQKDDTVDTSVFDERAAADVIGTLRDGLEGHSDRLMLSAFDDNKMDGYLSFEDQIEAMFQKYDAFTVHTQIMSASAEGDKGIAVVRFQMEELPRGGSAVPSRKETEIRFELEKGKKGWKIVDLRPRGFFS